MASSILEQDFQQSDEMMAAESEEATDNLFDVEEGIPIDPVTTIMGEDNPTTIAEDNPTTVADDNPTTPGSV